MTNVVGVKESICVEEDKILVGEGAKEVGIVDDY